MVTPPLISKDDKGGKEKKRKDKKDKKASASPSLLTIGRATVRSKKEDEKNSYDASAKNAVSSAGISNGHLGAHNGNAGISSGVTTSGIVHTSKQMQGSVSGVASNVAKGVSLSLVDSVGGSASVSSGCGCYASYGWFPRPITLNYSRNS